MPNPKRHTPDSIEELIVAEQYHCFPGTNLTLCLLKLKNGFTVHGMSGCVHDVDFDTDKGKAAARAKALSKIWDAEAYLESNRQSMLGTPSKGQPVDAGMLDDRSGFDHLENDHW